MDYLTNKLLIKKNNSNFIIEAKKTRLKLKKLIRKPIFVKRKFNFTKVIYVNDTHHNEKSFKIRGATSEVIKNFEKIKIKKNNTVVVASTGNFAYAMASVCKKNKINCIVFVTKNVDKIKLSNLFKLNAKVYFSKDYENAKKSAKNFAKKKNLFFSNGCNKNIFLGNATMMLDTIDELKKNDSKILKKKLLLVLPVGNGSLAAPSSIIFKSIFKNADIACVEPYNFKKSQKILNNKINLNYRKTVADGTAIRKLPIQSKKIIFQNCKYFFSFNEKEIINSMKYIFEKLKIISEGSGALSTTIILYNLSFLKNYDYVVIPICGGNITKIKLLDLIKKIK